MAILEQNWPKISDALVETVQLVTGFGFDGNILRASSALLPIAYYVYRLGAPTDFDANPRYEPERNSIPWMAHSVYTEAGAFGAAAWTHC